MHTGLGLILAFNSYVRLVFLILVFALPGVPSALAASACAELTGSLVEQAPRTAGSRHVWTNDFNTTRDLNTYLTDFSPTLARDLESLRLRGGIWMDLGAGTARAQRDFFPLARGKMELKALSLVKPSTKDSLYWTSRIQRAETDAMERFLSAVKQSRWFQYLEGRNLEKENDVRDLHADLLTDSVGPFFYSTRPDLVLRNSLNILRDNGALYLSGPFLGVTLIEGPSFLGSPMDWLARIQGLRVTKLSATAVRIQKDPAQIAKNGGRILIPSLELLKFQDGAPPIRRFRSHP